MKKNDSESNQEKLFNLFKNIKAPKISTPLQFYAYIAGLMTFMVTFGAGFLSETLKLISVCSLIAIFLIEIFIVTFLKYRGKL